METVALEGAKALAKPAHDFFCGVLSYAFSCRRNVEALEREALKLQGELQDMRKNIEDAERNGQSATSQMSIWLDKASKMCEMTNDVGDKFDRMFKCLGGCAFDIISSYQLSMKAAELKEEAVELATNIPPAIARQLAPDRFVNRPYEILVGRNSEFEKLLQLALDETVNVIGLCGMGGVGKTALLNNFHNDFHQKNPHYLMIWIDMEDHRSLEVTQKAIAERTGVSWDENERHDKRARQLSEYLSKRSFMLILDHVWKAIDLNHVGIPTAAADRVNSKVVVASRIEDVCNHMGARKVVLVKCLEWEDAWSLFEAARRRPINRDAAIREEAERLVKKCGGLPLALLKMGYAMAGKETPYQWKHAVTALENKPQEIPGMEDVLSRLKLSYEHLLDEKLRTCLLYCALYPEGHDILKVLIVNYCIGEGVLADLFYDGDDVYNEGYNLLDVLKSASLLQPCNDPNKVKIHPLIRGLVLWIESGDGSGRRRCLVQAGKGLIQAPDVDEWEGVERISLSYNNIRKLSKKPVSPHLLTLILQSNPLVEICDGFFHTMRNLRVLDLSGTSMEIVPAEIGELVQLQYLSLDRTSIRSLPQELGNLVMLRYFILTGTPKLRSIPQGLFAKLSELRALYMYRSYASWVEDSVGEGVNLEELETLKRLKALGISVSTSAALRKLIESYQLRNCTHYLELRFDKDVMSSLPVAALGSKFKALKDLRIFRCFQLEEITIDDRQGGSSIFSSLDYLALLEVPRARIAWKGGCLQNLTCLTIKSCEEMRELMYCCHGPTEDDGGEEQEIRLTESYVLPNLYRLELFFLPLLENLSCGSKPLAFPSLRILDVRDCPKLRKIPRNAKKLHTIYGQQSWWNRLEWPDDQENAKCKLESIFIAEYPSTEALEILPDDFEEEHSEDELLVVGRNPSLEQLQQLASDDEVSVIGIYGMPGVGKTRLLKEFLNQFLKYRYKMVYVDMDEKSNAEEAQKAIAESLGVTGFQKKSKEELARRISARLVKLNYMLILDNVWEVMDLNSIGIPVMTNREKSKVIIATRLKSICDSMATAKLQIKCLEWKEAWILFREQAGQQLVESNWTTEANAMALAKKCGGLPLALVKIANAMAKRKTPELWEHAFLSLESNKPVEVPGMADVLSRLRVSYDNLANDRLRECLLCASMFPEDDEIYKGVLADYCMAEGISANNSSKFCDELAVLEDASLLESCSSLNTLKLHPMIRVLSLWIASDKSLVLTGKKLTEPPDIDEWRKKEKVSFMSNDIQVLSRRPDSPFLLTLIFRDNPIMEISDGFFQAIKNLRVLDLSGTSIEEVPVEIGQLIELRYLDLSYSQISSLPAELGNLVQLMIFALEGNPLLTSIPDGLFSSLIELQALHMWRSYSSWKVDPAEGGVMLDEIHCLKLLKALGISISSELTLEKLAASPQLANSMKYLDITRCEGLIKLSSATLGQEFNALESFRVDQCSEFEELVIDGNKHGQPSSLPKFIYLGLFRLPRAKITYSSGCLQSLCHLEICDCEEMKQLINCTETLSIQGEGEEDTQVFGEIDILPNLYKLLISSLPELESLSCGHRSLAFPSLEVLVVKDCPKLKKLPLNATKLKFILGQASWWDGLEWPEDEDDVKSKFETLFEEIES